MISKTNKNIMITLSKEDLIKLEKIAKAKSKELGFKLTKSNVISYLINKDNQEQEVNIVVDEGRGNTKEGRDTSEMSILQQMIYFLNYDCRLSYSQIGQLFKPQVSDRCIKDYMYGKVKNPSESKLKQLKNLCKERGRIFN